MEGVEAGHPALIVELVLVIERAPRRLDGADSTPRPDLHRLQLGLSRRLGLSGGSLGGLLGELLLATDLLRQFADLGEPDGRVVTGP